MENYNLCYKHFFLSFFFFLLRRNLSQNRLKELHLHTPSKLPACVTGARNFPVQILWVFFFCLFFCRNRTDQTLLLLLKLVVALKRLLCGLGRALSESPNIFPKYLPDTEPVSYLAKTKVRCLHIS